MDPQVSKLVRGLGPVAAASVNIANMIGTGVFLKSRVMTCNVGTPGAVLAVWVAAGLLVLAGALTYAELAAMMPKAGGEYVFLRTAYGRRCAFLYGWTAVVASRTAAHAAQAVSTAIFLNVVTGGALDGKLGLAAVSAILFITLLNCARVTTTRAMASGITAVKIALVLAVGGAIFLFADGNWMNYAMANRDGLCAGVSAAARGGMSGFGAAMLGALWGYQGWANVAPMVGEIRDPGRNIPRAFLGATLIVGSVYVFANASYFYALSPTEVAGLPLTTSVATEALSRFLGPVAVRLMAVGLTVSALGAIYAGMAATIRVPYAMAGDGLFFRGLDRLSPRTNVPVRAAILIGAWMSVLALSGNYDRLTDYAIFALWFFYGLTASAVLVLRRSMPNAERPYRVWGYPVVPALFVLVTAAILLNTLFTAMTQTLVGLGFMALGLPFYAYWSRRASRNQA
jgi:basic amino acid/polyamine antiporter, APA family